MTAGGWALEVAILLGTVGLTAAALRSWRQPMRWWRYVGAAVLVAASSAFLAFSYVIYEANCEIDCDPHDETVLYAGILVGLGSFLSLVLIPPAAWLLRRRGPSRHPIREPSPQGECPPSGSS